jgi:hypothetical protein
MSPLSRLLRLAVAGTRARKRALVGLVAVPLATAFVAGAVLGVVAEHGGWGLIAILVSIPVALAVAAIAARALLGSVQSVRRTHSAFWLVDKLEPLGLAVDEAAPRRINIIHPAIDLKHFFGGFIAVFNLARRLAERGHQVRLIALEQPALPADWRERVARYEGIGDSIHGLEVAFAADRARPIEASPADTLVATHWTAAHVAAAALSQLRADRFLYLIQEYEPFIFPMGSAAALARGSYELPHRALFSTTLLREWFAAHEVGVFAAGRLPGDRDSLCFDNAITPVGPVRAEDLSPNGPGRLLFYARPEEHASRNMFEVGAMALDEVLASGGFKGWDLAGVGTVESGASSLPLPRSGASLRLIPRGPQEEYGRLLRSFDVGLALMYTPHPGLVAIEMAAAGMATVTNTYENKDAPALAGISPNLIAAEPSVEGVAAALAAAQERRGDVDERARASRVPWPTTWEEALDDETLSEVERLLG